MYQRLIGHILMPPSLKKYTINTEHRKTIGRASKIALLAFATVLVSCDRNSSSTSNGLLDDPSTGDTFVLRPDSSSLSGVLVNVLDEDNNEVLDATVFVLNDDINGNIVPDESETLLAENGFAFVPISPFEGTGVIRIEVEQADFLNGGGRYELIPGENAVVDVVLTSRNVNTDGIKSSDLEGDLSASELIATVTGDQSDDDVLSNVRVPQSSVITSVDGEVLDDSLTLSVVHYDARDEQALSAFPGGSFDIFIENIDEMDTPLVEGTIPSESLEPVSPHVTVQTLGFVSVELTDSAGRKAENISGEIDITMAVAPLAINPATGSPLTVGDQVALMSFNFDTARWVYEGQETIESNGRGGFEVNFSVDHLTVFTVVFPTQDTCAGTLSIAVISSDLAPVTNASVRVKISADDGANGDSAGGYLDFIETDNAVLTNATYARSYRLRANFSTTTPGTTIATITRDGASFQNGGSFDGCDTNSSFVATLDQAILDIPTEDTVNANISVNVACTNLENTPVLNVPDATVVFDGAVRNTSSAGSASFSQNVFLDDTGTFSSRVSANYLGSSQSRILSIPYNSADLPPRLIEVNETFLFDSDSCVLVTGGGGIVIP